MTAFNKLNPVQQQVVTQTEGPIMVLAGAGSGKTRTLVSKISYLLDEKQISAFQILALTFSNKAAREMRERVSSQVGLDIGALQVTTFHSFCANVLRNEATHLGLSRNFTIYDDSESKSVVKALLSRNGISTKELSPFEIMSFIEVIKNNGYYPGRRGDDVFEPDTTDDLYPYYQDYESEVHKSNAVDFGGLITGVLQLLENYPEVLSRYQNRYKYILVDEYQDTNRAQFDLVRLLAGPRKNICVVGDEDQSIYSWRGADIRNILDFEKYYPEVKVLKLEQNYRSTKNIIEAATHVISKNAMRKGKTMWTENPQGSSVEIIECSSDKKESEVIVQEIMKLKNKGVSFSDMAVFYRANAQSRLIEDALRKYKTPYRVVGGVKFYERKEIKDLLAYLRLVVNSKDSLALSRIINVPARGIGASSLRKLEEEAIRGNLSLWEVVERAVERPEDYAHIKLGAKIKSALGELVYLINEAKVLDQEKVSPSKIYEKILHESGYYNMLKASKDYENLARLENLEEFLSAIVQYEDGTQGPSLLGFLETITLDTTTEQSALEEAPKGEVCLMTVHGAKGLEFPYVFISGAEENVFPSYRSLEEGEMNIEEERRLFYVAMTRAMEKLTILFAQGRMLFGQLKFNGPSRFIMEVPDKYYTWTKKLDGESQAFTNVKMNSWGDYEFSQTKYDDDAPVVYQSTKSFTPTKFPKGATVVHSLYGKGTVLDTEGSGKDEKVTIRFSDGARKKFLASIAPIKIAEN